MLPRALTVALLASCLSGCVIIDIPPHLASVATNRVNTPGSSILACDASATGC